MMESPAPTVTVIIPCYNSAATLGRALDSVASQTLRPVQTIVVDDASADWAALLSALEEARSRYGSVVGLQWMRLSQNRGPGAARNAGWEAAIGKLVAFLDADDAWSPDALLVKVGALSADVEATAIGGRSIFCRDLPTMTGNVQITPIRPREFLLRNRYATSSVVVQRAFPLRFREDWRYCEDYDLWLRMAYGGWRALLAEPALTIRFKRRPFASGLSSRTWRMARGEIDAYRHLHSDGHFQLPVLLALCTLSFVKAVRRLAVRLG